MLKIPIIVTMQECFNEMSGLPIWGLPQMLVIKKTSGRVIYRRARTVVRAKSKELIQV